MDDDGSSVFPSGGSDSVHGRSDLQGGADTARARDWMLAAEHASGAVDPDGRADVGDAVEQRKRAADELLEQRSQGAAGRTDAVVWGHGERSATGGCNVLYAAVSRSFVAGDVSFEQLTEGLFPAPSAFGAAGTPSMVISFADCSGAFDVCSGEPTGSVTINVGGILPVADGFADVAQSGLTRTLGSEQLPDIRAGEWTGSGAGSGRNGDRAGNADRTAESGYADRLHAVFGIGGEPRRTQCL